MTIGNLIPKPRAKARTFYVSLDLKRVSNKFSKKIGSMLFGSTRRPFPRIQSQRLLEAALIARLDLLPGSSDVRNFQDAVFRAGWPRFLENIWALAPSGNLHRLSSEVTIIYQAKNDSLNWFKRYVNSKQFLIDIDTIWLWQNSARLDVMIKGFSFNFNSRPFPVTYNNRVKVNHTFADYRIINGKGILIDYQNTTFDLHVNFKQFKPSYSDLFYFLSLPEVQNDVSDYDLHFNIKYDLEELKKYEIESATSDLLNWFYNLGHSTPPGTGTPDSNVNRRSNPRNEQITTGDTNSLSGLDHLNSKFTDKYFTDQSDHISISGKSKQILLLLSKLISALVRKKLSSQNILEAQRLALSLSSLLDTKFA